MKVISLVLMNIVRFLFLQTLVSIKGSKDQNVCEIVLVTAMFNRPFNRRIHIHYHLGFDLWFPQYKMI